MLRTINSDLLALATASLTVSQRLDLPPGRCLACRDWPPTTVIWEGEATGPPYSPCPCGFSPLVIEVEFVTHPLPR